MAVNWGEVGGAAAGSAAKGLIGSLFGFAQAKQNWKFQKKQMALAQQYEKEAFDWETQRQDYLLQNTPSLTKQALQKAGYSAADPNGTGTQVAATPDMGAASPGNAQYMQMGEVENPITSYLALKQAELMGSQSNLAQEQAEKTKTDADKARAEIKVMTESLPLQLNKYQAEIDNLVAQKELNEEQAAVARQEFTRITELIHGIQIDNEYKPGMYQSQIKQFQASADKMLEEKKYQEYVNGIAKFGIFLNTDSLTNFMSVVLQHPETAAALVDGFAAAIASASGATADLLKAVLLEPVEKIVNKVKSSVKHAASDTHQIVSDNAGMPRTR